MKHFSILLLSLLFLLQAEAQEKVDSSGIILPDSLFITIDTVASRGLSFWNNPHMDTVAVIMLVTDTSKYSASNASFTLNGYMVRGIRDAYDIREAIFTKVQVGPKITYLDESKCPLNPGLVVWMSKEIN